MREKIRHFEKKSIYLNRKKGQSSKVKTSLKAHAVILQGTGRE